MSRPSVRAEKKRAQIRRAAYACFRDRGYHETSVDAICDKAKVSKGSFYWHYQSKHEVFMDILEVWTREIMAEVYEQFEKALGEEDYVDAIGKALQRESHRGRAIVPLWLEFTVHAQREPEIKVALSKMYARARSAIAEILRPMLSGLIPEEELRGLAATIFGAFAGIMMQEMADPVGANAEQAFGSFMNVVKRGVGVATPAPSEKRVTEATGPVMEGPGLTLLTDASDEQREMMALARSWVLRVLPGVEERVVTGWKNLSFADRLLLVFLKPVGEGLQIGIYDADGISDPHGVLRRTGKKRGVMTVESLAQLDTLQVAIMGVLEQVGARREF